MQIILVKSVRKLGNVGEIVNVANGYGRNYLIPQNLAIKATKDNLAKFTSIQKNLEEKNIETKHAAEKTSFDIKEKSISFITQSASDGRLFGSVSAKAIALELSKLVKITLNHTNILLNTPIKFNGVYNVQVALHPEVITNILVVVAKTDAEAQTALKEFKETTTNNKQKTADTEEESNS